MYLPLYHWMAFLVWTSAIRFSFYLLSPLSFVPFFCSYISILPTISPFSPSPHVHTSVCFPLLPSSSFLGSVPTPFFCGCRIDKFAWCQKLAPKHSYSHTPRTKDLLSASNLVQRPYSPRHSFYQHHLSLILLTEARFILLLRKVTASSAGGRGLKLEGPLDCGFSRIRRETHPFLPYYLQS